MLRLAELVGVVLHIHSWRLPCPRNTPSTALPGVEDSSMAAQAGGLDLCGAHRPPPAPACLGGRLLRGLRQSKGWRGTGLVTQFVGAVQMTSCR